MQFKIGGENESGEWMDVEPLTKMKPERKITLTKISILGCIFALGYNIYIYNIQGILGWFTALVANLNILIKELREHAK